MNDEKKKTIPESVGEAVERTFQSTLGSAAVGKERAQEIVDEIAKRGGESARSAGEIGHRIRESIKDLRLATGEDVKGLHEQVSKLEKRLAEIERKVGDGSGTGSDAGGS